MNLLMVRHGEIPANIDRVYAGRSPEKLTERGIVQAREVSEKLKRYGVHAIYSSPINRAIQTAEIIGHALGIGIRISDSFGELIMGPWEGLSEKTVAIQYPHQWHIWNTRPTELNLPGRETLEELLKRVMAGIQEIHASEGDHTVTVVTHVAVIRVLLLWKEKKSLNLYKTIQVPNAEVFEIRIK